MKDVRKKSTRQGHILLSLYPKEGIVKDVLFVEISIKKPASFK